MRTRASTRRVGFTLVELVVVIVLLGILAGVALPMYVNQAAAARRSGVLGALGGVRAGIAGFYANGAVNGQATHPTLAELLTPDAVLLEPIGENPLVGNADVRDADGTWTQPAPVSGPQGWAYDQGAGKFWSNTSQMDSNQW